MQKDSMLVEFLKKENAVFSLMYMLEQFNVLKIAHRGFKTPPNELWISRYDIKVFCTEWVKNKGEQRRETSESNPWARLD